MRAGEKSDAGRHPPADDRAAERIEASFEHTEIRLMIAHWLAHQKRHDLAWNWLPTVAGWLFYYHPLVWLMTAVGRRQEAACDQLLIERNVSQPADYGRLLLKLALSPATSHARWPRPAWCGAYRNLERRMLGLGRVRPLSPRRARWAFCALLLAGTVGIVPRQLRHRKPSRQKLMPARQLILWNKQSPPIRQPWDRQAVRELRRRSASSVKMGSWRRSAQPGKERQPIVDCLMSCPT